MRLLVIFLAAALTIYL